MLESELKSKIRNMINCHSLPMFVEMYDLYLHDHQHDTRVEDVIGQLCSELSMLFRSDKNEMERLSQYFVDCLIHIAQHPVTNHAKLNWASLDYYITKSIAQIWGANNPKIALIETLMKHYPTYDIDIKDSEDGATLLMTAVNSGASDADLVRELIKLGADIHITSANGQALHYIDPESTFKLRKDKMMILLEEGADPELKLKIKGFAGKVSLLDLLERTGMPEELAICKQFVNAKKAMAQIGPASPRRKLIL